MSPDANEFYGFGPYRISSVERVLRRGDEIVPLTPKCIDTLLVLARNAGKVVDKETLMQTVWPDAFVEEGNLAQNIFTLRKALGETPDGARYIQTIPKRGYLLAKPGLPVDPRIYTTAASNDPVPARPAPKSRSAFPIAPALACAMAAAGWIGLSGPVRSPQIRITPLNVPNSVLYGVISPDGSQIAYVSNDPAGQSLWIRPTAALDEGRRIVGPLPGAFWGVAFAPSGDSIYYTFEDRLHPAGGMLYRIPAGGGGATRLMAGIAGAPSFSPDGQRLVFKRNEPNDRGYLLTASASGGEPQVIASSKASYSFYAYRWSDNGKNIDYVEGSRQATGSLWSVFEIPAAPAGGRAATVIPPQSRRLRSATWLNRSEILAIVPDEDASSSQIWRLTASAPPQRLTAGLNDYILLSVSSGGRSVLATSQETRDSIWSLPASGGDPVPLALPAGSYNDPTWTPDGRVVSIGQSNIWISSPDGAQRKPLLPVPMDATEPMVSPDGRFLIFVRKREGIANLWRIALDGSGLRQLTTGLLDWHPSLSPDGHWVIYASNQGGYWGISKAPIEAREQPVHLVDTHVERCVIAPGGSHFAFVDPSGVIEIRSFADGSLLSSLTAPPDASDLAWTPDGVALTYISRDADVVRIWRQPVAGGPPAKGLRLPIDARRVAWSGDASRIVYLRRDLKVDLALISNVR